MCQTSGLRIHAGRCCRLAEVPDDGVGREGWGLADPCARPRDAAATPPAATPSATGTAAPSTWTPRGMWPAATHPSSWSRSVVGMPRQVVARRALLREAASVEREDGGEGDRLTCKTRQRRRLRTDGSTEVDNPRRRKQRCPGRGCACAPAVNCSRVIPGSRGHRPAAGSPTLHRLRRRSGHHNGSLDASRKSSSPATSQHSRRAPKTPEKRCLHPRHSHRQTRQWPPMPHPPSDVSPPRRG